MVGNGNHPLETGHYDDHTLEEYLLGHLQPVEEGHIQQHLEQCPRCRAQVAGLRTFLHEVQTDLRQELETAQPPPRLDFDAIATEWRKPPRRVSLAYRLARWLPNPSYVLLMALFVAAFVMLVPSASHPALHQLDLSDNYTGPPSMVAAATDNGLVILRLAADTPQIKAHLGFITHPRNLTFSPDARWLAVQQDHTLHIIRADTGGVHLRINVGGHAEWAWSPDSQRLAYTDGRGQLVVFDLHTNQNTVLVPLAEQSWTRPVWTADGRYLAYATRPSDTSPHHYAVWRVDITTGYRIELARSNDQSSYFMPLDWIDAGNNLIVLDVQTGTNSNLASLYLVDAATHQVQPITADNVALKTYATWPPGPDGSLLAIKQGRLIAANLRDGVTFDVLDRMIWPNRMTWSSNGAWIACTISGAMEGRSVYAYAVAEGMLRPFMLPGGAVERAVAWAGPEDLFVVRQQSNGSNELWHVPVTSDDAARRVLSNIRLPTIDPAAGWRWQDVFASQPTPR